MIGAEGVAQAVADLLLDQLVGRCDELDERLGPVVDDADPRPRTIYAHDVDAEQVPADNYPWVSVRVGPAQLLRPVDVDDEAATVYLIRYDLELFAFVIADGYEQAQALRNRLQLALRETLLAAAALPGLGQFDPLTLREDRSPTGVDEQLGGPITAGRTAIALIAQESLPAPTAGTVGELTADVALLPVEDPLDDFGE